MWWLKRLAFSRTAARSVEWVTHTSTNASVEARTTWESVVRPRLWVGDWLTFYEWRNILKTLTNGVVSLVKFKVGTLCIPC